MKERPILFSGEMVRAILEGGKTQTRRVVKPALPEIINPASVMWNPFNKVIQSHHDGTIVKCPYGQPGDRLWVRETWCELSPEHRDYRNVRQAAYRADGESADSKEARLEYIRLGHDYRWKPSIHMPRWASRITLEITNVRVERLQEITPDDCRAEGMPEKNNDIGVRYAFGQLWQSIHGPESWDANPWVWVIEFRRIKP